MQLVQQASYFNHFFMTDETIIPTDAPEGDNLATSAEVSEGVDETSQDSQTSVPDEFTEVPDHSADAGDETPVADEVTEEEIIAATVRATPLTALSARPERQNRGR